MAASLTPRRSPARSPGRVSASAVRLAVLLATTIIFVLAACSALFAWRAHRRILARPVPSEHRPTRRTSVPLPPNVMPRGKASSISKPEEGGNRASAPSSILDGLRVLATIVSFDFMQLSHLEEVLDGFRDLCYAGSKVDIVVYTTVLYPVALIDMFNDRMRCNNPSKDAGLSMTLILKPSRVRLHLVDFHRELFYDKIDRYDLFVYTEEDIRISPTTVAAYLHETRRVESIVGPKHAANFNVGIVRYEYDFPENVVMTDKTRHANVNVTRVYWEHLGKPIFGKAVNKVKDKMLAPYYVSMHKPHQGMYLATPTLLKAWKIRRNCRFNEVRDRPSKPETPHFPTQGTQRVWMSSKMMYGKRHCNVKQLLPVENFGQLTVLHLPNKNYRRVGKRGRLGGNKHAPKNEFSDGTEVFRPTHPDLLKALELHVEMKRQFRTLRTSNVRGEGNGYTGIRVVDADADLRSMGKNSRAVAEKRLDAYRKYVQRGGYLTDADMDIDIDDWRTSSSL